MPTNSPIPDELTDPPPRFGMRAVLIWMTVLALLFAHLAPIVRDWELARWLSLVIALGAGAASATAAALLQGWAVRWSLRDAGHPVTWLVLADQSRHASRREGTMLPQVVAAVAFSIVMLLLVYMSDYSESAGWRASIFPAIIGFQFGMPLWLFRRRRLMRGVGLGPKGLFLASGMTCYRWRSVAVLTHPTDDNGNQLTLRIGGTFPQRITAVVPEDQRKAVESLLAEKLPPRRN